jgi:hypothetical protein
MENVHLSVIPAKAGIHWLQVLRDPCLRRDDGEEAFFDTLFWEKARVRVSSTLRHCDYKQSEYPQFLQTEHPPSLSRGP